VIRDGVRISGLTLQAVWVSLVTVPPILSYAAISLCAKRRPLLVWRGLPAVAVAAAMRASAVVQTPAARHRLPHDKPAPRTLLPISRRSRLAAGIAAGAGRPLPGPFTPYLCHAAIGGSALCCRLASQRHYCRRAPACCFAGQPSIQMQNVECKMQKRPFAFSSLHFALVRSGSREVPLEVRSSGGASPAIVTIPN
jgi:hypothetical protein